MIRFFIGGILCAGALVFSGCGAQEDAQAPVSVPKMESTWVRTEKVRTTKQEVLDPKSRKQTPLKSDPRLAQKLKAGNPKAGTTVTDEESCLARWEALDQRRTQVQREGGVWHAFERDANVRPYSNYAMQLDSKINTLIHALEHLCRTARGVPLDELSTVVSRLIEKKGKEETRVYFLKKRLPKEDVDRWLEYTDFAIKNRDRVVDYEDIGKLISNSEPLIDLYEDLPKRKLDESNRQRFLADSATLLEVLEDQLGTEKTLVMAQKEEVDIPYENLGLGDL